MFGIVNVEGYCSHDEWSCGILNVTHQLPCVSLYLSDMEYQSCFIDNVLWLIRVSDRLVHCAAMIQLREDVSSRHWVLDHSLTVVAVGTFLSKTTVSCCDTPKHAMSKSFQNLICQVIHTLPLKAWKLVITQ